MNPTTPNPTLPMTFIAGSLLLMSIFTLFSPQTEKSSQEHPSDSLTQTQVTQSSVEAALFQAY